MTKLLQRTTMGLGLLPLLFASGNLSINAQEDSSSALITIQADIWVDNWFALYRGDRLIQEDSVAFNTEQSFNKESFTFASELPAQMGVIIKDYFEDDTGLEYIGSRRQQMGDGGFQAQFFDAANGEILAVSNDSWRCKVIHQAPLNADCERDQNPAQTCQHQIDPEPDGWKSAEFDDSAWPNATIHTARAVRPIGGYHSVNWHPEAKLIWSEDLEIDNAILCRFLLVETAKTAETTN